MTFEIIETKRLYLRKLTDEIYEHLLQNGTDDDIIKYLNVKATEVSREREKAIKGFSTHSKSLLIFQLLDKDTDEIIGWCGYHTWYKVHRRAEIGYAMTSEEFRDRGLMSEALKSIIDFGFKEMKLNRIEAHIGPGNIPSLKLIRNVGFTQEGLLRSHYNNNGIFEDSVVYSLLSHEY